MRNTSLLEYTLIALVIVLALSLTLTYVWPPLQVVLGDFKLLGEALAGTK